MSSLGFGLSCVIVVPLVPYVVADHCFPKQVIFSIYCSMDIVQIKIATNLPRIFQLYCMLYGVREYGMSD